MSPPPTATKTSTTQRSLKEESQGPGSNPSSAANQPGDPGQGAEPPPPSMGYKPTSWVQREGGRGATPQPTQGFWCPHMPVCQVPLRARSPLPVPHPHAHSATQDGKSENKSTGLQRETGSGSRLAPALCEAIRPELPHGTIRGSLPSYPFLLGLSRISTRLIHTKVCMTDPGFRSGSFSRV